MLLILLVVILLFAFPFGGSYYNGGAYRNHGFGLGAIFLIILLFLLLSNGSLGRLHF